MTNATGPYSVLMSGKRTWIILSVVLFLIILFSSQVVELITDWLWFQEVGYENVFTITLLAQLKMALLFGLAFFVIFYGNLFAAMRLTSRLPVIDQEGWIQISKLEIANRPLQLLILIGSLLLGLFAALIGSSQWENFLRFLNVSSFGVTDPLFQRDVGFYVFRLPFLNHLYSWLMMVLIFTTISTAFLYFVRRAFHFALPRTLQVAPAARVHLSILLALIFFVAIFGLWLALSGILFVKRGVVFGPGYTDVTTQLWVLKGLMGLAFLCGVAFLSFAFKMSWRYPAITVLFFVAFLVFGRGIYPAMVQSFKVVPNEIVLEKPYIEKNIQFTRLAYRLNDIEDKQFPVEENLTREDLKRNDLTIKNIRLWNHDPLLQTYSQLQEIRTYYKFGGVDNDRYQIDGEYRQVMLSPRELSYASLPSRSWVNEHIEYTHGYGAVLSPVNRISKEGLPEFFIKDIPPASTINIKISRPEIYYGENSNDYVFVRTNRPEFDYPVGNQNVYSKYEGKGGVGLSFLRKLLFAVRFGSFTMLLSDDITPSSRIMYYRQIKDRVARIVPFAELDSDPYLVISPEGRLLWFLDGYTMTSLFPYSEPTPSMGNYIRNSFKAVVDAYDGSVKLYISDEKDPIIQTYARIFPGVFKKLGDMQPQLQKHIRYPSRMLSIQARMYRAYHMQDAQVFYNKEDLWATPAGVDQEMEPYYTIMKLPEEQKEEFILLLPFTPSKRDNMSAWMGARCDAPNYGKVIVYLFSKDKLVYGPQQIEARINQDTAISKELSLWNQRGSQVIRGGLLAIPIEKSILYVESLYLAAEKGQLPELKRVILAYGNSIVMEENLELALQQLFGGEMMREKEIGKTTATMSAGENTDRKRALEALSHYRKAQNFLHKGDWGAYGEELRKMDDILRSIESGK
ncbi:MAG: UPF0182 family protein [Smithella sp.]|jgi:uncharacterized membrane protein (UPF0182 family)